MAGTKVKGIIVQSLDYKEKDKIVKIFTLENGLIQAVFRGVRNAKSKLKASKDVFVFGDFFIENTKGFNIITGVDVVENFFSLSNNLDKFFEACSIIDVVKKLATQEKNPQLFIETLKSLKVLTFEDIKQDYVFAKFLLEVFKLSGYPINFDKCSSCKAKITGKKFFNFDFGEILCSNCRTSICQEISSGAYSVLKILNDVEYDKLCTVSFPKSSIQEILKLLKDNFASRFTVQLQEFNI